MLCVCATVGARNASGWSNKALKADKLAKGAGTGRAGGEGGGTGVREAPLRGIATGSPVVRVLCRSRHSLQAITDECTDQQSWRKKKLVHQTNMSGAIRRSLTCTHALVRSFAAAASPAPAAGAGAAKPAASTPAASKVVAKAKIGMSIWCALCLHVFMCVYK
jgi:hypothetical protein